MKDNRIITVFLGLLTVVALGMVLSELRVVLLPFVIAALFSIMFNPIVVFLQKRRVPIFISLVVVLLAVALVVFLLVLVFLTTAESFVEALPRYEARLDDLVERIFSGLILVAGRLGYDTSDIDFSAIIDFSMITRAFSSGVDNFVGTAANIFMILLFMMFILAGTGGLADKVRRAFPERYSSRIAGIITNVNTRVRQYLATKTLISAGTGTLTWLVLFIIGVDFPVLWGVMAFLLNFIPNIGSITAAVLPFILALLQFETMSEPLLVLILLASAQLVMGNVVEPRIMAFSLDLSPLLILISLIFWGWLWGIWGMVLAVPLTAMIKIIFENIEPLKPFSILMSGPKRTIPKKGKPRRKSGAATSPAPANADETEG